MTKRFVNVTMMAVFGLLLLGVGVKVRAADIPEIPYTWESYFDTDLDWYDGDDETNSGATALGFTVSIGGASYSYFDMDSNGYVELLSDALDSPVNYGWGYIWGSTYNLINADPASTYLLAAYDDLSSYYYNYYGYKLFTDRAVFYYDTETYADEDSDYPNVFEIFLYDDGTVQWNFRFSNYSYYDADLFTGLYFGNTQTLLEAISNDIPQFKSYLYVPEPATLSVLLLGSLAWLGLGQAKR